MSECTTERFAPGDYIHIPAQTPYRVLWTTPDEPTVWLTVVFGQA